MSEMPKTFVVPITTVKPVYIEVVKDGGEIFAHGWKCPNCNVYVNFGDKYCHECGMKMEWK